ncbi:MAG: hypothetical protein VBE63_15315 [Lamprobacter sp.]|uniref:hypothetical protein n=1 Tax=Lamprobacter sp. TaxID=3100796 RepID=UPI002B258AD2|nr:hypothetical protein [Lamprobacter sp.]MEA3641293.1 hypothetical protein [Lamprobacter sp.]
MTWQAAIAALNTAVLDLEHGFGEPLTLADGSQIQGLFTLNNPIGYGYGVELTDALEQQPQPTLRLLEADATTHAAQLATGQPVTITRDDQKTGDTKQVTYIIAEPPEPDGHGMSRVALMDEQPQDTDPNAETWRWR